MLRLLRGNQEAGMLRRDVYMRLEQHAEPREPVCSVLLKQQWHMDMTWRPPSTAARCVGSQVAPLQHFHLGACGGVSISSCDPLHRNRAKIPA